MGWHSVCVLFVGPSYKVTVVDRLSLHFDVRYGIFTQSRFPWCRQWAVSDGNFHHENAWTGIYHILLRFLCREEPTWRKPGIFYPDSPDDCRFRCRSAPTR
jgi:hypothetical protein